MTTLTNGQVERASKLKREGKSLRQIAAVIGSSASTVKKALDAGRNGDHAASTLEKIRVERLAKLRHQNAKLSIELKRLQAKVVDFESLKADVLRANAVVKNELFAMAFRMAGPLAATDTPQDVRALLTAEVTRVCNSLAYEREIYRQPGACPCCGAATQKE
jgi:predicted transcriptional regulator